MREDWVTGELHKGDIFDTEEKISEEASQWASEYLEKNVTTSNISYLIQYGRIKKLETTAQHKSLKRN